jgi:outer membrane receptor protein involved in Fe transport
LGGCKRFFPWLCGVQAGRFQSARVEGCAASGLLVPLVAALSALSQPAWSKDAVRQFDLPRGDLSSSLIALALQGDISIGGQPHLACGAPKTTLKGQYTVSQALEAILRGTGCTFRMVDAHTALILQAVKPNPAPASVVAWPERPVELVVTGERRNEPIDRSPYDVTRLGQDELADGRVFDSGGLASLVAGMTVTNFGPGRDKILLRGLSDGVFTGRTQSTVSLYLDDVPLTYNAPDPDLRLIDVDAVEVLRGPQGVLYGAGSIGGVVHIITHKPDLDTYSGSLSVTGSLTQSGGPSTILEGMANMPLLPGRLGLRVVAYRETDGGYINDPVLHRTDVNQTSRTGARALVLLQLSRDWKATLGGVYQSINSADTQYGVQGLAAYTRDNLVQEPHDNDFDEISLVVEGRGAGWRFKSSTSRARHQISSQYDASDSLALFAPGLTGAAPFNEDDRKSILSQEFTLASDTIGKAQWIVGVFAQDDQENSTSRLTDISGPAPPTEILYSENRSDSIDDYAAYGEVTYTPLPKLFLTVGGRFFQSTEVTASAIATPTASRSTQAKIQDQGFAPKVVVRYQASPRAMIYFQATEGYRGGGVNTSGPPNQVFGAPATGAQPFQRYTGDELWNYEIGAKVSAFDSRLTVRTAVFYDSWQNIQTDQILPSGLPFTANVGDGLNKGLEIEAFYQPSPHLFFRGNAVFNDPELINRAPGFASIPDASLPGVSRSSFGAELTYRRPLSETVTVFATARASYIGKSTVSFDAATTSDMGRYATGTITAGLQVRAWRVQAFIDNPANTAVNTFAFGDPFSVRTEKQTTPLRPRTIGLSLSAVF